MSKDFTSREPVKPGDMAWVLDSYPATPGTQHVIGTIVEVGEVDDYHTRATGMTFFEISARALDGDVIVVPQPQLLKINPDQGQFDDDTDVEQPVRAVVPVDVNTVD